MGSAQSREHTRTSAGNELARFLAASAAESGDVSVTNAASPSDAAAAPTPAATPSSSDEQLNSFTSVVKKEAPRYWWWGFERSELPNPGVYDEMSQDAQMVLRAQTFEGFQFNMTIPQSQHLASGVAFEMGGKDRPAQFALLNNYFTNNLAAITRLTPSDSRLSGRIFYRHTPALTSKLMGEVGLTDLASSKLSLDAEYRGSDYCGQLKLANGGVYALTYLQSVAPWLALGGEGFFQSKSMFSAITFAAKYTHGNDSASLTVATFGPIFATFVRRLNNRCALAAELFVDARTRDSHAQVGYRFDLRHASVTGVVDSAGRVAATVEEKINPGFALLLSAELDHQREDYKFGFGINFGQ